MRRFVRRLRRVTIPTMGKVLEGLAFCCCHQSMLPYKTWKSVVWFVATWLLTLGLVTSLATSYWLVGPKDSAGVTSHWGFVQDCKVSLVSEAVVEVNSTTTSAPPVTEFSCSGIRTNFQPLLLLVVVAILGVGVFSLVILAVLTLVYCFCDQLTACGRSYHTLAGLWQGTSSLLILVGIALFPVTWDQEVITNICGTSKVFYLGECVPGYSFYIAIVCAVLGYFVAGFSTALDGRTFETTEFESMESLDTYKQGF